MFCHEPEARLIGVHGFLSLVHRCDRFPLFGLLSDCALEIRLPLWSCLVPAAFCACLFCTPSPVWLRPVTHCGRAQRHVRCYALFLGPPRDRPRFRVRRRAAAAARTTAAALLGPRQVRSLVLLSCRQAISDVPLPCFSRRSPALLADSSGAVLRCADTQLFVETIGFHKRAMTQEPAVRSFVFCESSLSLVSCWTSWERCRHAIPSRVWAVAI